MIFEGRRPGKVYAFLSFTEEPLNMIKYTEIMTKDKMKGNGWLQHQPWLKNM